MRSTSMTCVITIVYFSQTDNLLQFSASKAEFPKKEFVSANYNTITNFALNANSKPVFAKVNGLVTHDPFVPLIVLRK